MKAALVKGSFKTIVQTPKYVDVNEWVAINRESQGEGCPPTWIRTREDSFTGNKASLRFLQQLEPLLFCPDGVLHPRSLPDDVCRSDVSADLSSGACFAEKTG